MDSEVNTMKKIMFFLLLLVCINFLVVSADKPMCSGYIYVNGKELQDYTLIANDGEIYVPVDSLMTAIGANVVEVSDGQIIEFNGTNYKVIYDDDDTFIIKLGDSHYSYMQLNPMSGLGYYKKLGNKYYWSNTTMRFFLCSIGGEYLCAENYNIKINFPDYILKNENGLYRLCVFSQQTRKIIYEDSSAYQITIKTLEDGVYEITRHTPKIDVCYVDTIHDKIYTSSSEINSLDKTKKKRVSDVIDIAAITDVYIVDIGENEKPFAIDGLNEVDTLKYYLSLINVKSVETIRNIHNSNDVIKYVFKMKNGNTCEMYVLDYDVLLVGDTYYLTDYNNLLRINEFVNSVKDGYKSGNVFSTTEASEWSEKIIKDAANNDMIPKWNRFNYKGNITRIEACQLINNFFDVKFPLSIRDEYKYSFAVVDKSLFKDTMDPAVNKLYSKNIVFGNGESKFLPYEFITREEFACLLKRTYDISVSYLVATPKQCMYSDFDEVSVWAQDSVLLMSELGLFNGNENNEFMPKEHITKEQVIVLLMRLSQL